MHRPPHHLHILHALALLFTIATASAQQPRNIPAPTPTPPAAAAAPADAPAPVVVRVAAWELGAFSLAELQPKSPAAALRTRQIIDVIQRLRPNILVLSGVTTPPAEEPASSRPNSSTPNDAPPPPQPDLAAALVTLLKTTPTPDGRDPLDYIPYTPPTNSGIASGLDLNRDGIVTNSFPTTLPNTPTQRAESDRLAARYSADCWGPGTFPGERGLVILVDSRLTLQSDRIRTFRLLPWDYMPAHAIPTRDDGTDWFSQTERDSVRLTSTIHADIPVRMPNGGVLHILASNPIAPNPEGPRGLNARRNHDEIRFWADYVQGQGWVVDDSDTPGGLDKRQAFVIAGNLNIDRGDSTSLGQNPVEICYVGNRRINTELVPLSEIAIAGLKNSDTTTTSSGGSRTTYTLPSRNIEALRAGVWRHAPTAPAAAAESSSQAFPSAHFPVWVEVAVPHWAKE